MLLPVLMMMTLMFLRSLSTTEALSNLIFNFIVVFRVVCVFRSTGRSLLFHSLFLVKPKIVFLFVNHPT